MEGRSDPLEPLSVVAAATSHARRTAPATHPTRRRDSDGVRMISNNERPDHQTSRANLLRSVAVGMLLLTAPMRGTAQTANASGITDAASSAATLGKNLDSEEIEDLGVKVIGGFVSVVRTRLGGQWTFNPELSDLRLAPPSSSCGVASCAGCAAQQDDCLAPRILRGDNEYKLVGHRTTTGNLRGRYDRDGGSKWIEERADGWRWEDLEGRWIEYDQERRASSYGDRNGAIATIQRDAQGWVAGFVDRAGHAVVTYEYDANANIVRASDHSGRQVLYSYLAGHLVTVTDVRGNVWTDEYSGDVLVRRTDPEGRKQLYLRNGAQLTGTRDEDGFGVDYQLNYSDSVYSLVERFSGNRIVESAFDIRQGLVRRELNGRAVLSVRRDANARITTDENGNDARMELDAKGRVTSIRYADGSSVHAELDQTLSLPRRVTNENGVVTALEYDARGNPTTIIEASGRPEQRVTLIRSDADGQILELRQVVDGATADRVTRLTYDAWGNVATLTGPEGGVYAMAHDVMGNITEFTDPLGSRWSASYDAAGDITRIRDPLGATALYEYDRVGHLVAVTDAGGSTTRLVHNRQNNLTEVTDPLGGTWHYEYTEAALLARAVDPRGANRVYSYDRDGRLRSYTDQTGGRTTYEYLPGRTAGNPNSGALLRVTYPTYAEEQVFDPRGRVVLLDRLDRLGRRARTRLTRDDGGNLLSLTTPDDQSSHFAYDAVNRLTERISTDGATVRLQMDPWGQRVVATDPLGHATTLQYDKINRLVSEMMPNGSVTRFEYDAKGNLLAATDPLGQAIRYDYDAVGRNLRQRTFAPGESVPSTTAQFVYGLNGDLLSYDDGAVSGEFTYDALGRTLSSHVNYGPFTRGEEFTYSQDGRPETYTAPDGKTYRYDYDGAGMLRAVQLPDAGSIVVNSRTWFLPSQVTFPGGVSRRYEYDEWLRPTQATSRDPGNNVILDQRYEWSDVGLLTRKTIDGGVETFGYDRAYRLVSDEGGQLPDQSFGYDAGGNRFPAEPGERLLWRYGVNNELLTTETSTYSYDARGNRTRKVSTGGEDRYFYDERGRLTRVESDAGAVVARYGYDVFGRRVWKDVNGVRTYFYYSPEGVSAEMDSSGNVVRAFGWMPNSGWTTAPLFVRDGGGYGFFHSDQLGSPQRVTDTSGAVVWSARYESFGAARVDVDATRNPFRLPGQFLDDETGLHNNLFRTYDPAVGRYLEADPLGLGGGFNRYGYADGNPLVISDELGLRSSGELGATVNSCRAPEADPCVGSDPDALGPGAGSLHARPRY